MFSAGKSIPKAQQTMAGPILDCCWSDDGSKVDIYHYLLISAQDPKDFGFLDPDPQKYADPRIRIQGVKFQPKTAKKTFLLLKPKSELLKKKRDYKNFMVHKVLV